MRAPSLNFKLEDTNSKFCKPSKIHIYILFWISVFCLMSLTLIQGQPRVRAKISSTTHNEY